MTSAGPGGGGAPTGSRGPVIAAAIGAGGVIIAAVIAGVVNLTVAPKSPTTPAPAPATASAPAPVAGSGTTAVGAKTADARPESSGKEEYADNRAGSPVFHDVGGGSVGSSVPGRIPFGTRVIVECKAPNRTGISSITALYRLSFPDPWVGLYAASDTFTNGDPLGGPGATNVDSAIPDC